MGQMSCTNMETQWKYKQHEELGRGQRTTNMTRKGLGYQISSMNWRQKMYSRLLTKCGVIEDLLYSIRNMIVVKEMLQLNVTWKLLMPLYREYSVMLREVEQM